MERITGEISNGNTSAKVVAIDFSLVVKQKSTDEEGFCLTDAMLQEGATLFDYTQHISEQYTSYGD